MATSTGTVTQKAAKKVSDNTLLSTIMGNIRQYGIVGALIIIVLAFQILTGGVLLKPNSFVSLLQQNAYVIILAIGMVMVIIATHIDLSVGSLVAFIGGVCALLMEHYGVNWLLAILISIILGLVIGVWNGFWVAYVHIPGFITTLAGAAVFALFVVLQFRSRAKIAKSGLEPEPMSLTWIKIVVAALVIGFVTYLLSLSGSGENGGIPYMLIIVGVLVVVYNFILTRTVFGRHVYAVGGNRKAARLSGIDDRKVDFFLYIHMGFLSAVAAVCMLSRLASATAQAGMEFEMDAIAACFIGGTAVTGGIGTIPGAVVGAFVMGVINQGLSIMGVDTAIVKTIKGLVLLGAVAVDLMSKRKKG